jgi:hypothetical protein
LDVPFVKPDPAANKQQMSQSSIKPEAIDINAQFQPVIAGRYRLLKKVTARLGCRCISLTTRLDLTVVGSAPWARVGNLAGSILVPRIAPGPVAMPYRSASTSLPLIPLSVLRGAIFVLLLGGLADSAAADESEFCRQLSLAVAAQPDKFRSLRTERFDNRLESFETDLTLQGFETCRVDPISHAYFCMARGLTNEAGDELAGELVQRVHSCYPHVRAEQGTDPASPVRRTVTDWAFENGARIRIVRRVYRDHLGSVFLYVR